MVYELIEKEIYANLDHALTNSECNLDLLCGILIGLRIAQKIVKQNG